MDQLVEYFNQMPSTHRTIILVSGLVIFSVLEGINPFFSRNYKLGKHAVANIFFTLTTALVNFPLAFLIVLSCEWVVKNNFGIVQWLGGSTVLFLTVGLLLMDLVGAWLVHYVEHHVKWMWKFHAVHHTDQHVDTTSGNRHHPGESVFRLAFTILAVFVVGAPIWLVFLYQTISVIMTQFNHSNVSIPGWLDKSLGWLLVTPDIHRVHHHYRMPYSDSNFGNIFSIWDRIFRTFQTADNQNIRFGLDTHMEEKYSENVLAMLKMPFEKYRPKINYDQEEKI